MDHRDVYKRQAARTLGATTPVYRDDELALYRIGGQTVGASPDSRRAMTLAHLAWLTMLILGAVGAVLSRARRPVLDRVADQAAD